jgi:hypothetical protein
MEAVRDLPRLRRALSRALRIQTAAIAADDFDLRMLAKPFGCSGGCAILQHIDNLAPLQVNDNAPVVQPFRQLQSSMPATLTVVLAQRRAT